MNMESRKQSKSPRRRRRGRRNKRSMDSPRSSSIDLEDDKIQVVYETKGPLYLDLRSRPDGYGAVVKGFRRREDNSMGEAEASGRVFENDLLSAINDEDVLAKPFSLIVEMARTTPFPLVLTFSRPETMDISTPFSPDIHRSATDMIGNEIFPNRRTSVEERRELIDKVESVRVEHEGEYHSGRIVVKFDNDRVSDEDQDIVLAWYRATASGDFFNIRGVTSAAYHPSVDDIDARICLQCQSRQFGNIFKLVEIGPIQIDPNIQDIADVSLEQGLGSFSATLASNDTDMFQIRVDRDQVLVLSVSQDDRNSGVLKQVAYGPDVQVVLDPVQRCRFTLIFQPMGYTLGQPGDQCDINADLESLAALLLDAQSPANRDIIGLVIRRFRSAKIQQQDETMASANEAGLNVAADGNSKAVYFEPEEVEQAEEDEYPSTEEEDMVMNEIPLDQLKQYEEKIKDLEDKFMSMSLVLKVTENEKNMLATAIDVRETRLHDAAEKMRHLEEKLDEAREETAYFRQFKAKCLSKEKELQKSHELHDQLRQEICDLQKQLEQAVNSEAEAKRTLFDYQDQVRESKAEAVSAQEARVRALTERNSLKTRLDGALKELRRLVHPGRSVQDVEQQLLERKQLAIDLAISKAHARQVEDENLEYKEALKAVETYQNMDQKKTMEIMRHNVELKRLVESLTQAALADS